MILIAVQHILFYAFSLAVIHMKVNADKCQINHLLQIFKILI